MQWMVIIVVVLALAWVVLRQRPGPRLPPKPKIDPRRRLAVELVERAKEARDSGRFAASQGLALRATWLKTQPPLGHDEPPTDLNPNDPHHLQFVDQIRLGFGEYLRLPERPYADCRYAPEAMLPYPKAAIRSALQLLLDLSAGRVSSVHVEPGALSDEMLSTVESCVRLLDSFVDVAPEDLPTDPEQNAEVGKTLT